MCLLLPLIKGYLSNVATVSLQIGWPCQRTTVFQLGVERWWGLLHVHVTCYMYIFAFLPPQSVWPVSLCFSIPPAVPTHVRPEEEDIGGRAEEESLTLSQHTSSTTTAFTGTLDNRVELRLITCKEMQEKSSHFSQFLTRLISETDRQEEYGLVFPINYMGPVSLQITIIYRHIHVFKFTNLPGLRFLLDMIILYNLVSGLICMVCMWYSCRLDINV